MLPCYFFVLVTTYISSDIRNFYSSYTIVNNLSDEFTIFYIKNVFFYAFIKNLLNKFHLFGIKILSNSLYAPYIPKETCAESSVSVNYSLNSIKVCLNHLNNFFIWAYWLEYHLLHSFRQHLEFCFHNSHVYVLFTLKIGIECSSTFFRCQGNIIHSCIVNAIFCK